MKNLCLLTLIVALLISLPVSAKDLPRNYIRNNMFESMKDGDKAALVMVHFGSAYRDAREKVLEVMNRRAEEVFGDRMTVREAYAARSIVKRLAAQNIDKKLPMEVLEQLKNEGFTHVIVQPSFAIEGVEMEVLRREVEDVNTWFKDIRIGNPLMYGEEDYLAIINLFAAKDKEFKNIDAKLFAAHGTYTAANASYAQLGYMLSFLGHEDFYTGTVEGFPTIDDLSTIFKRKQYKSVVIIPCMFVLIKGGDNEVSKYWQTQLKERGFDVTIYPKGLGEHPEVQQIIINHINYSIEHKRMSSMERKNLYR